MKVQELNPVIMTEEDYNLLKPYVGMLPDSNDEMSLAHELKRAVIVKKEAFPLHAIKLNSRVSVLDQDTQKVFEFVIVMPGNADMKLNKISVLTPMGAALIGFRKGEEVKWKVPAGLKRFRILDVSNK
ncbi:MAG: transcription elongation factor GreAB [Sphingobacteriales bacterium]|nr:MAG: transcription elongation factor GreAB [Sphingobacteriales bacterium]